MLAESPTGKTSQRSVLALPGPQASWELLLASLSTPSSASPQSGCKPVTTTIRKDTAGLWCIHHHGCAFPASSWHQALKFAHDLHHTMTTTSRSSGPRQHPQPWAHNGKWWVRIPDPTRFRTQQEARKAAADFIRTKACLYDGCNQPGGDYLGWGRGFRLCKYHANQAKRTLNRRRTA